MRQPLVSVWFVEQNPLALESLSRFLQGCEFQVISEKEACEGKLSAERLVLVIDEGVLGPERRLIFRSLRTRFPEAKFLVLGREPARGGAGLERLVGIDGFVPYDQAKEQLTPALRALANGRMWLPRGVLECFAQLAAKGSRAEYAKPRPLTLREAEVVRLLTEGLSNKEIGNQLGITERTVKFHVENVFGKLGVRDRFSAAEVAHRRRAFHSDLQAA
jgi:DNA-binding NarL/FixJ family response regulator